MRTIASRIPSLDGLRAISIVLVLVAHCVARVPDGSSLHNALRAVATNGTTGVSVFFVISGFLITTLLQREDKSTGRISLKDFYVRRVFRIIPAYVAFVAVVALAAKAGWITVGARSFVRALTFTMDYEVDRSWYLGHTWSLSVEEQFYLVWPLLMYFCRKRTLILIASGVIVLEPLIRMSTYFLDPSVRSIIIYMGHTRADMISFGCLLALVFDTPFLDRFATRFARGLPALLAAGFLLLISPLLNFFLKGGYQFLVGYTLEGLAITVVLLYLVLHPERPVGRPFNSHWMTHIGVLSYSLYLWQELFLGAERQSVARLAVGVGLALLAAEASYHLVEQPMLGLRVRLAATAQKSVEQGVAS